MLPMLPELLQGYVRGGRWGMNHGDIMSSEAS
jgi:hypothetical protein